MVKVSSFMERMIDTLESFVEVYLTEKDSIFQTHRYLLEFFRKEKKNQEFLSR